MRFFEHQSQARSQTLRLLLLFGCLLVLLVLAVNGALALAWLLIAYPILGELYRYPHYFFEVNTGVCLLFVLGGWYLESAQLQSGGESLARRAGAREAWPASRADEQKLCNIVAELAIAAAMRHAPLAMVLPRDDSINAFAAGWQEEDAVIAVTQGALDHLSRDELQGLVAHELSHLREGDTRLNMHLAGMVAGLSMLFNLGCSMCARNALGQRSFLALPGVAIVFAGFFGWIAGRILQAAVSRQREFLADARAVQFTRSRDGLGGVLRKVQGMQRAAHADSLQNWVTDPEAISEFFSAPLMQQPAVQHMLLVGASEGAASTGYLASHPQLAERIRRIYGRNMPALRPEQEIDKGVAGFQNTQIL